MGVVTDSASVKLRGKVASDRVRLSLLLPDFQLHPDEQDRLREIGATSLVRT